MDALEDFSVSKTVKTFQEAKINHKLQVKPEWEKWF